MAHIVEIRVRYADTDHAGVVNHINHFRWLEIGRAELMRSLGKSWKAIEDTGLQFVIIEVHCKYFAPARYDDLLAVETWVSQLKDRSVVFDYKIYRKDDKKELARAHTIHVCTDKDMKPVKIPDEVRDAMKKALWE